MARNVAVKRAPTCAWRAQRRGNTGAIGPNSTNSIVEPRVRCDEGLLGSLVRQDADKNIIGTCLKSLEVTSSPTSLSDFPALHKPRRGLASFGER